jgi:hypothetical protein
MSSETILGANRFMLEFLGHSSKFGLLPISTVVLACDFENHAFGAARQSFAHQEAIAIPCESRIPEPPWALIEPEGLGRYLSFLRKEIIAYAEEKPIKAIKRVLSLGRTIGLHAFGDEALQILRSATARSLVEQQRLSEVAGKYARAGELERQFLAGIHPCVMKSGSNDSPRNADDAFRDECRDFIARFLQELARLEAQADGEQTDEQSSQGSTG